MAWKNLHWIPLSDKRHERLSEVISRASKSSKMRILPARREQWQHWSVPSASHSGFERNTGYLRVFLKQFLRFVTTTRKTKTTQFRLTTARPMPGRLIHPHTFVFCAGPRTSMQAAGFEIVHATCARELVTWEQTKVMAMFLRCLRFVFGGHLLRRESSARPGSHPPVSEELDYMNLHRTCPQPLHQAPFATRIGSGHLRRI